ncbi:hypothetical protein ACSBR1_025645 [Camellia fascicularis]
MCIYGACLLKTTRLTKVPSELGLKKILQLLTSGDINVQIHAVKVVANLAAEGHIRTCHCYLIFFSRYQSGKDYGGRWSRCTAHAVAIIPKYNHT